MKLRGSKIHDFTKMIQEKYIWAHSSSEDFKFSQNVGC